MKLTRRDVNRRPEQSTVMTEWSPFSGIFSLKEAMDRLFNESFWAPFGLLEDPQKETRLARFSPRVDISETEQQIKLRADLPGIDPEKINVEVAEDSIKLSGRMERSSEEKRENYYRIERIEGEFSREFMLPSKVDPSKVDARAKNGVLTIILQKLPSEQKKKVRVQVDK